MDFAGLNHVAVMVAALASFLFGGLWYGIFSKQWLGAVGKTEDEIKSSGQSLGLLLGLTLGAQLLMAWVLAGVIGHLGHDQMTAWNGVVSGGFIWLGFVFTTLLVNHRYQGASGELTLIDGGHWLCVLLIQGAIIGYLGV